MNNNNIIGDVLTAAVAAQNIKERDYWLNQLSGEIVKATFPSIGSKKKDNEEKTFDSIRFRLTGDIFSRLIKLSNGFDYTLHMLLAAAVNILIYKYSGIRDIIIGSPIYKQEIKGTFINTILALRNKIETGMTIKEFLLQVRETIVNATENQNYPIETLLYKLDIQSTEGDFPLFDIAVLLENIHNKEYLKNINLNVIFSFQRTGEYMEGNLEYNQARYDRSTCEAIIHHFMNLMQKLLFNLDMEVEQLELLSDDERKQVLDDFNDTQANFPTGKTICDLFEEQAILQAEEPALIFAGRQLTYRELSRRSTRLSQFLRSRGVGKEKIVGIMVERSFEMIIGMLGILKAGGAYLPIDCQCPQERLKFMIKDSELNLMLIQKNLKNRLDSDIQQVDPAEEFNISTGKDEEKPATITPDYLAYIIYTSGSTGKAKGVAVEHSSILNTLLWRKDYYQFKQTDVVLQVLGYTFDSSVEDIFTTLSSGARLVLIPQANVYDLQYLAKIIIETAVTYFLIVPGFYKSFLTEIPNSLIKLRAITVAGESVTEKLVKKHFQLLAHVNLYNEYGPTENSVCTTAYQFSADRTGVLIGKPISNVKCYILHAEGKPTPIGVPGELYAAGKGLSRGYLKQPELTEKKFVVNPFAPGEKMYRTGDMARWLVDGNIEFLGRIDFQVKIRGFRIELGEIENQIMKLEEIKDAVVIAWENSGETPGAVNEEDKHLCAYLVSQNKLDFSLIRKKLSEYLPDYMIPLYIMQIARIPLTPNGKIDRKALPRPEFGRKNGEYTAPRDSIEERLVEIWSELLKIDRGMLGIDVNFFESGGHSLVATILVSKINKEFKVRIPMVTVFEKATIRELAQYIKIAHKEKFTSIEPVEKKEYYPLSSTQESIYVLQQMKENNTAYHMFSSLPLQKDIDPGRLEATLQKIIARHESLRTSFEIISGQPVQKIHNSVPFKLAYYETDKVGIDNLSNTLSKPFDLSQPPLLRATLVNAKSAQSFRLLFLEVHHIITDETSQGLLQKEFELLYNGKELPHLRLHYKDYACWQSSELYRETINRQGIYWLKEFTGKGEGGGETGGQLPVLDLYTDYPRPLFQSFEGNTVVFGLSGKETELLREIAREQNATVFIVLLTVISILFSKLGGQEDIIIGTPNAGRNHADLEKVIGMFINTIAVRNYPRPHKTFKEFLTEVKIKTLEIFENQEYPFDELVEKLSIERNSGRNPLFDVMLNLVTVTGENYPGILPWENMQKDEVEPGGLLYKHMKGACRFDLTFLVTDSPGGIFIQFIYCTALFKPETAERIITYFKKILAELENNSDRQISNLEIMPNQEKHLLLYEFNSSRADYPNDRTIIQLYEMQARKTPDIPALIFEDNCLTYKKLDEQTNSLGRLLRSQSISADTLVGLMVERSLEMVVGILGIMKAGGAYLPINPTAPVNRIKFMLDNANVTILLTQDKYMGKFKDEYNLINLNSPISYKESIAPLENINKTNDLAYIIYTSGSTGLPKGVMIQIRSVINIVTWFAKMYGLGPGFNLLQMFEYTFDASINQIFGSLLHGVTLHIIRKEYFFDIEFLRNYIITHFINLINFVQSVIKEVLCGSEKIESLQYVISGAEKLKSTIKNEILDNGYALYNQYGPTEVTVDALAEKCSYGSNGTVGIPVANTQCYIVNRYGQINPLAAAGELWVSGDGLARGYINNVELTAEKFTATSFIPGNKVYRTGDLTRWLPNGNVEFLGRIDTQVKIRGFRIEPVEIANQLVKIEGVKEAVVIDRENSSGETYLCAYLVAEEKIAAPGNNEIKNKLSRNLPDYMIPTYYVWIDRLPLSGHGKLIKSELPEPDINVPGSIIPPSNPLEKKLVEIWSEVLNMDSKVIGINSDFFELGGHSLKATILVSKLQKELNVKVPLSEVFRVPTVKDLALYIGGLKTEIFEAIDVAEKRDYYPLSTSQRGLFIQQNKGPGIIAYNMPHVLGLNFYIDKNKLEQSFKKLIQRHESIRTAFILINNQPIQKIHPDVEFVLQYYDDVKQDKITEIIAAFVKPFDLAVPPLLRVGLIRWGKDKYVLLFDMHHIITDGVSSEIFKNEIIKLYNGEELPPLRIQYKDYSVWQNSRSVQEKIKKQKQFWLSTFAGEIPILKLPLDFERPVIKDFVGKQVNFSIDNILTAQLDRLMQQTDTTLYMVLLAAYFILLSRYTNQEDIVVGSPATGRRHVDLHNIIGMFVNMLAIRNRVAKNIQFRDFLQEIKKNVIACMENQDYHFEELVTTLGLQGDPSRNPLFDAVFSMQNISDQNAANLPGPDTGEQANANDGYQFEISRFDLLAHAVPGNGKIGIKMEYSTSLFRHSTIQDMSRHYLEILQQISNDISIKLDNIKLSYGLAAIKSNDIHEEGNFEF